MKKYLVISLVISCLFSFDLLSQISFQTVDTVQFNTEDFTEANLVDIDQDGNNELVYFLNNKIYSIKNFQDISNANKSLIVELPNIRIRSISNFVDYNNDGFLDLAIVTTEDGTSLESNVIFIKGSENGFTEDFRVETPEVRCIKFIDFDQDGSYELFYSIWEKFGYVDDWQNGFNGFDKEFEQESVIQIEAVDYNKDGLLDLVTSGINSFHIYNTTEVQEVNLVFSAITDFTQDAISYGDINLDGFTDFIYRKSNDIYSVVFDENTGFTEDNLTASLNLINAKAGRLIDIDLNNTLDLVFKSTLDQYVYLKNQNGEFGQLEVIGNTGLDDVNIYNLLTDDFDDDGYIDILTYDRGVYNIVYTNQNQEIKEVSTGELYNQVNAIASFDMDNDGNKDLISIAKYGAINIVYDYKNNLNGEALTYPIQRNSLNLNILDVDKDGILDIIYYESSVSSGNSFLYLLKGLGNQEFEEPVQWKDIPNGNILYETDLDKDGVKEFVTFRYTTSEIVIIDPYSGNIEDYNNSDNVLTLQNGNGIRAIDIGDITGNDSEDIVSANYDTQNISILINDETGAFTESNIEVGMNVNTVKIFDYNFDGHNDLLLTVENPNQGTEHLQVYVNDGEAGFSLLEEFDLDVYQAIHIDIIDIDDDGDEDILVGGYTYMSQKFFENRDGAFEMVSVDIDNLGQVYRIFDDIDGDGKIDFYSTDITFGNTYIQYNNSVAEPTINEFNLSIQETDYANLTLTQSGLTASSYIVLMKEDSSSTLNQLPQDNSFYAANAAFGNGGQLDGAFVVYSGNAASFEITNLKASSTYKLFALPYNSNDPNNTIINYTDTYTSLSVATDSSIYLIQDLPVIEVDEDSNLDFDFSAYIFDDGINTYTATTDSEDVALNFDSNILKVETLDDFFGELTLEILVENEFEERSYTVQLIVNPVNDPPVIQEAGSLESVGLESTFFNILVFDVDDATEELSISFNSSNNAIVDSEAIDFEILGDSIQINFTPLNFGTTTLTVSVADSEFEVTAEFEIEIKEQVLSNLLEFEGIKIYPNPVSNFIYFEGINSQTAYKIFTLGGKVVMEANQIPSMLDISGLEDGIYIFVIENKQYRFIKK